LAANYFYYHVAQYKTLRKLIVFTYTADLLLPEPPKVQWTEYGILFPEPDTGVRTPGLRPRRMNADGVGALQPNRPSAQQRHVRGNDEKVVVRRLLAESRNEQTTVRETICLTR
jgi:hypothetical protein